MICNMRLLQIQYAHQFIQPLESANTLMTNPLPDQKFVWSLQLTSGWSWAFHKSQLRLDYNIIEILTGYSTLLSPYHVHIRLINYIIEPPFHYFVTLRDRTFVSSSGRCPQCDKNRIGGECFHVSKKLHKSIKYIVLTIPVQSFMIKRANFSWYTYMYMYICKDRLRDSDRVLPMQRWMALSSPFLWSIVRLLIPLRLVSLSLSLSPCVYEYVSMCICMRVYKLQRKVC